MLCFLSFIKGLWVRAYFVLTIFSLVCACGDPFWPSAIRNGLFWDQNRVRKRSKRRVSKVVHRPLEMSNHFSLLWAHGDSFWSLESQRTEETS